MSRSSTSDVTAEPGLEDIEEVFGALAHATRRHILLVLRMRGGRMTSGEIAGRFACRWPTTSRHLRRLQDAGLVRVEKQGRERVYHLVDARLRDVAAGWLEWFDTRGPASDAGP